MQKTLNVVKHSLTKPFKEHILKLKRFRQGAFKKAPLVFAKNQLKFLLKISYLH